MILATHKSGRVVASKQPRPWHLIQDAAVIDTVHWEEAGKEETGGPRSCLIAHLIVLGLSLHLQAIQVRKDSTGGYEAVDPSLQPWITAIEEQAEPCCHLKLGGRLYFLFAHPYER